MAAETHVEVERKYDADSEAAVPSFAGVPEVTGRAATERFELRAVYYDTADFVLAAHRMTLRRRTGGDDAGWHLKTPGKGDERTEYRAPLGDESTPPDELLDRVRGLVLRADLAPVARIDTDRAVHRYLGAATGGGDAPVLFELADDRVEAATLPDGEPQRWREWEVELVDAPRGGEDHDLGAALLDRCEELIVAAGASRAEGPSKLSRVLGDRSPEPPGFGKKSTVGDVAQAYLGKNVDRLRMEDGRVRHDLDDAVHQFRVACRRLRSAFGTYKSLYDPAEVQPVRDRLKALGATLGEARDSEVLRDRLLKRIDTEDEAAVVGPVHDRVEQTLQDDYDRGLAASVKDMSKPAYFDLLAELAELIAEPSVEGDGRKRAGKALDTFLAGDWRRLRKRVQHAAEAPAGDEHDLALHEVRKGAKRLRYGAESAVVVLGRPATDLAEAAEHLQEVLGDRQDGAVARQAVLRLTAEARDAGEDTFTYGRLHAIEDAEATENQAAYADALERLNDVRPAGSKPLPVPGRD